MSETILRFAVMSDVHVHENRDCKELARLEKGMKCLYSYSDGCEYKTVDAIFVVGDFANSGKEQEMLNFKEVFYANLRQETDVTISVASHEYGSGIPETHERMRRLFGMEPDIHKIIKGYHFISVTPHHGTRYEKPQIDFSFNALEQARLDDPEKAIFFFQHPHVNGTVYGSYDWGEKDLLPTFINFPQIIDFSGHSHAPINDPRNVHQEYFTCFGTGSFSYTELDEFEKYYGTVPPDCEDFSQFLIVEVDDAGVVTVKSFDVITGQFFPCDHVIRPPFTPENFIYTDKRYETKVRPYFTQDTPIKVDVRDDKTEITFGQAEIDEEMVNDYLVTVTDLNNGKIVRRASAWSGYYHYYMPESITVPVMPLPAGEYRAKVLARGFWKNTSENELTADFSVK